MFRFWPTKVRAAMQAMQLLASSGVIVAAGAMISLLIAVSPPGPVPVPSQQHRPIETVGAAIADDFDRRWHATDEMPLLSMPHRDPLEGLVGGTQVGPDDLTLPAGFVHGSAE